MLASATVAHARLLTPPTQAVEVAVATTIAIAALHALRLLFGQAERWMALCFGLIHGMAFSATLSGAGLTPWQHAQALLAFNLGIESMQLLALGVVLPPLLILGWKDARLLGRIRLGLAAIASCLAAVWVGQRLAWVDFAGPAWFYDGGEIPLVLVAGLWLLALARLLVRRAGPGVPQGANRA